MTRPEVNTVRKKTWKKCKKKEKIKKKVSQSAVGCVAWKREAPTRVGGLEEEEWDGVD